MKVSGARAARVLLVDDDDVDSDLTRATLESARIAVAMHRVDSGEQALAYLNEEGDGAAAPDLVLLDVKMPGMNGIETLHAIKSDLRLKHIPVIMLSSSTHDEDILRSYAEQAYAYLTKPIHVDSFRAIVRRLENFCFVLSVLPQSD